MMNSLSNPSIKIKQTSSDNQGWKFEIEIQEGPSKTNHKVTVDKNFYQNLTQGKISVEELIRISFEFLLEREPKESILGSFNIEQIQNYFSEYSQIIRKRIYSSHLN